MNKKIRCDLCNKKINESEKIIMENRINKINLNVCKECFDKFFNK